MGRVHSIQSLGTVDGPGVRCVVFMQGCPLRCGYCHNPDTWDLAGGEELSVDEVFRRVKRLQPYFKNGGGLTVSGGEPLLQEAFTAELFSRCREAGIHTCLDTSGCIFTKDTEALLAVTDLVLLDIKMTTDEEYREYIGCPMAGPLRFWDELEKRGIPVWVRQVIVPGLNDTAENIARLSALLAGRRNVERVQLLPFKKICAAKYQNLGLPFRFEGYPHCPEETVSRLEAMLEGDRL
ncbi:MAG: pyruvate formate lyase-activating protein [Oscillospiraceae bacterium]|jgi:pyruvate formate lyase activating enzyme|nr:pyruvate formate lyase-activating protein [Oscillospiraceae bacterium]